MHEIAEGPRYRLPAWLGRIDRERSLRRRLPPIALDQPIEPGDVVEMRMAEDDGVWQTIAVLHQKWHNALPDVEEHFPLYLRMARLTIDLQNGERRIGIFVKLSLQCCVSVVASVVCSELERPSVASTIDADVDSHGAISSL